jgi:amino-acid N-acetyltransferase
MNATPAVSLRPATLDDVDAISHLITDNLAVGHLLPRTREDLETHATRFTVATDGDRIVGCAELAPLSTGVAEVRSLVVDEPMRGRHIGSDLIDHVAAGATGSGFSTLCAFTHDPSPFVRLGFTIVPHIWVPEKIARDCTSCALFRHCGQYAVMLPLRAGVSVRPERPAALIQGSRSIAQRRPNIERLQIPSVVMGEVEEDEAVLA